MLLVEAAADLRELNELILRDSGYHVEAVAPDTDLVAFAQKTQPDVIVLHIRPNNPADWEIIDHLDADPQTEAIPVVVLSTSERVVTEAHAVPVVREAVVMPYDIDALRDAVAKALGNPPPAAVLPSPYQAPPPTLAFAGTLLSEHSREIVLRTIRRLQQLEPFKSRFAELSPALVGNLPVILGTVVTSIQRSLEPRQVTAPLAIRKAIKAHVELRIHQGVSVDAVIEEYQELYDQILGLLREQIGLVHFTALDAFDVARMVGDFIAQIVRVTVKDFLAQTEHQRAA
ncbi:MAG TPA: hypothetical protein VFZ25_20435 [Chloroflexota bacterium]|nr:hypothetical protein [Chloroflexota bacterium]